MTLIDMQLHLEQFDELFVSRCIAAGMDSKETKRHLLDNPQRKLLVDSMVELESVRLRPYPILIMADDCQPFRILLPDIKRQD